MDVARTAKRLGATEVNIVYRRRRVDMTALSEEIEGAIAEGCNLIQLKAPARIEATKEGKVKALWVKPQLAGESDSSGRPRPVDASAEEECIPCQIIISAIGQGVESHSFENCGIPVVKGSISASASSEIETMEGLYAGGDCVTGPSTVINAIAAGKVAAANIDTYLGYCHEIQCDVDIPEPRIEDKKPCGRMEMRLRYAKERGEDFHEIEQGLTKEEAEKEASRCLRCDYYGQSSIEGGRIEKW